MRANLKPWMIVSALIALVILVAVVFSIAYWDWLRGISAGEHQVNLEPPSVVLRNIVLGTAGICALIIATWRGLVANQQSSTTDKSLLNERYQTSANMLGSDVMAVRLAGIYALRQLAREYPKQYHIPTMRLFCAFARHPVNTGGSEIRLSDQLPEDVQEALTAMRDRDDNERMDLEMSSRYYPDLSGANLRHADLINMNLSGMLLDYADLSEAWLSGSYIMGSTMYGAILHNAHLKDVSLYDSELLWIEMEGSDLSGADLEDTLLSGARFSDHGLNPATGLTHSQLSQTRAEAEDLPDLTGVLDTETGDQLLWNGRII